MLNHADADALPQYLREAVSAYANASFDAGDWRNDDDTEWGDVFEASQQAEKALIEAIIRYRKEG